MGRFTAFSIVVGLVAILAQHGCTNQDAAGGSVAVPNSASSTDAFVGWPLPADEQAYGTIDGRRMWQYVQEQAEISRRHRDEINPQFWGRVAGSQSDVWSAEWLLEKYQQIGLTDTRIQDVVRFLPEWVPESWEVTATAGGQTITLTSAQPPYGTTSTDGRVLDLPAAWAGLGTEADFSGRDVRGRAVFLMGGRGCEGGAGDAESRAQNRGAAVIFSIGCHGGNFKYQSYRPSTTLPTFDVGTQDGATVREMIEQAPAASPPRIRVRLDAEWVDGTKSFLVWGTLPGATDETIYVVAHRDGWFDAAGDNATGVASMLGLAEYFAQVPQSERRRTMVFIGMDGHHELRPGWYGAKWLVENREQFFSKTALFINMEHPSQVLTHGGNTGWTETIDQPPRAVPPTVLVQPPPGAWGEGLGASGDLGKPAQAGSPPLLG